MVLQPFGGTGLAQQATHRVPAGEELFHQVTSDEATCTGHESFHGRRTEVFEMIDFVAMVEYIEKTLDIQTRAVRANLRDHNHDAFPAVRQRIEATR
jgi:hypothetical protein